MPESDVLTIGVDLVIIVGFAIILVVYVGYNFADVDVKMNQTFTQMEAKHIVHLAEYCLKDGKWYIDLEKADLKRCMFGADEMIVTDALNPKNEKKEGWNKIGNRNHKIAVNIKDGDEIHPGWLYVEF